MKKGKLPKGLEVTMNDKVNKSGNTAIVGAPGLLTDDQGKRSMMRMMSLLALIASIWFAWMTITDANNTNNEGVYITTAFLLAAFAPKAMQKFIENSYPPQKPE